MSSSNRIPIDDPSRIDLPVFLSSTELVFTPSRRRSLLTIYNPYGKEAQFHIMTTSPDRYDISNTRGNIKPNRRIDITLRLHSQKIEELAPVSDELQTIDYFKVCVQIGQLKGTKQIRIVWCQNSNEVVDSDDPNVHLLDRSDDRTPRFKIKTPKSSPANNQGSFTPGINQVSNQRTVRSTVLRPNRLSEHPNRANNINLVCTLGAIACVITLFLPLSIDTELCKRAQSQPENNGSQFSEIMSQLVSIFSVSYEMKLGCSFALGLFTYRLISTMPD